MNIAKLLANIFFIAAAHAAFSATVSVDWNKGAGKIKPLHGVNNSPVVLNGDIPEFREAGIPFVRTHDTSSAFGGSVYIDVPNIFRDFDADPSNPDNYDFSFTDAYLKSVVKSGAKIFYRLGVTIENSYRIKAYRIHPPKDYKKWAEICAGIIRHYNKGWANGFNYGIEYWEIWNEPENHMMWTGTMDDYMNMYAVAANYLKKEFPEIKIGGYAGCGFFELTRPLEKCPTRNLKILDWFNAFVKMGAEKRAPIDFYSWHLYTRDPEEIAVHAKYVRETLDKSGLSSVKSVFNEWNYELGGKRLGDARKNHIGAAFVAAAFSAMQCGGVDMAMYYCATPASSYGGLHEFPSMDLAKTYFAFKAFNKLYQLGEAVETAAPRDEKIYALAAIDRKTGKKAVLLTNYNDAPKTVKLKFDGEVKRVFVIDEKYKYTEINFLVNSSKVAKLAPYATLLLEIE